MPSAWSRLTSPAGARDIVRREFDSVWQSLKRPDGGDSQQLLYYRLVSGTSQPLPKRAGDRF